MVSTQTQKRYDSLLFFEDKGYPFFLADDGGKFTWKENDVNRGAKATVLWPPFMTIDENFED